MKNRIVRSTLILVYIGICSSLALLHGVSDNATPANNEVLAQSAK